ncbi:unnamed protein product, partial [Owenia fusiformis]
DGEERIMNLSYCNTFILCIFLIRFVNVIDSAKCKSCIRERPVDGIPTNSTRERTLSFLAEGEPSALFTTSENFHKTWKLYGVNSRRKIIRKGREFVEFVKERFGVDVSAITDEQLYLGRPVEIGDYAVSGFVLKNNLRVVTENTPHHRVKYYKNSHVREVGFISTAKRSMVSTGQWNGTIPKGGSVFIVHLLLSNNECDFTEEPDIIEAHPLEPFYVVDGFVTFGAEILSNKYGHGTLRGLEMVFSTSYTVT